MPKLLAPNHGVVGFKRLILPHQEFNAMISETLLSRFNEEVLRHGAVACLPCNLNAEWLEILSQEAAAAAAGVDDGEVATLLAAVILLLEHVKGKSFTISPPELLRYINMYAVELGLEGLNRETDMQVKPATIETILTNRKFSVVEAGE